MMKTKNLFIYIICLLFVVVGTTTSLRGQTYLTSDGLLVDAEELPEVLGKWNNTTGVDFTPRERFDLFLGKDVECTTTFVHYAWAGFGVEHAITTNMYRMDGIGTVYLTDQSDAPPTPPVLAWWMIVLVILALVILLLQPWLIVTEEDYGIFIVAAIGGLAIGFIAESFGKDFSVCLTIGCIIGTLLGSYIGYHTFGDVFQGSILGALGGAIGGIMGGVLGNLIINIDRSFSVDLSAEIILSGRWWLPLSLVSILLVLMWFRAQYEMGRERNNKFLAA